LLEINIEKLELQDNQQLKELLKVIKKREVKRKLIRKLKRLHREKKRKLRRQKREHRKHRNNFWTKKVEIDHSLKLSEKIKLLKQHYREFLNNRNAYNRAFEIKRRTCSKNRKDTRIATRRAKRRFIRNLRAKRRFERIKRKEEEKKN